MLQVLFNHDGSLKALLVGESIQQGDHESKQLFASIEGYDTDEFTAVCEFVLPNGTLATPITGTVETEHQVGDKNYDGYSFVFTEAQTYQAGNLKVNLKLKNLSNVTICTYQFVLKINPTGYDPTEVNISNAQYNSLLQSLNSYALKTDQVKLYKHRIGKIIVINTKADAYDDVDEFLSDLPSALATRCYFSADDYECVCFAIFKVVIASDTYLVSSFIEPDSSTSSYMIKWSDYTDNVTQI